MCKKADVKSVSFIEAMEKMVTSLSNGCNVKITTYTDTGVEIESEIETNIKSYTEMEILIDILSIINSGEYNNFEYYKKYCCK